MRTRIYVDGKPAWTDNEEGCYARRQGHGGSAMGHYSGVVLTVGPSKEVRTATQLRRLELKRAAKARRRISQKDQAQREARQYEVQTT